MGLGSSTEADDDTRVLPNYTMDEVKQHNKAGDLWVVVRGKVYDMSEFHHPGGSEILQQTAGEDAVEQFEEAQHSSDARKQMKELCVGVVVEKKTGAEAADKGDNEEENQREERGEDKRGKEEKEEEEADGCSPATPPPTQKEIQEHEAALPTVTVLFGSQSGSTQRLAESCATVLKSLDKYRVELSSMDAFEPEDLASRNFCIFICSTFTDGKPPKNATFMLQWLVDAVDDFRITNEFCVSTGVAVFGVGSSDYDDNFNKVARTVHTCMRKLGARNVCASGVCDVVDSDPSKAFETWLTTQLLPGLDKAISAKSQGARPGPVTSHHYIYDDGEEEEEGKQAGQAGSSSSSSSSSGVVDMEDLGSIIKAADEEKKSAAAGAVKEMLNAQQRSSLTKQGYKLIGSHSGVKLCRWTKAMLRGRGGCYKHTFYGISSYQCMEMTPSLACANKCVFCWRHHTNPVGKEWKWVMDPPEMIIEAAISKHQQMIKTMKGVPGVQPARFQEAFTVKHCALSLVGEPIMYPKINEYLKMLHERNISSFLVTNAQFPDKIQTLDPVCQLYVSVDASTKQELKEVDRPLFSDFWERFLASLTSLKDKRVRTVYRLTLVKGFNMSEVSEYAKLVTLGQPTFIEIKGVTFCGNNNKDSLTMQNVPFHTEVRDFCEALCKQLDTKYEIACEHAHSCCILISDTKLKVGGVWHTWIDYPKFNQLAMRFYETGETFTDMDYIAPTPSWAVYGAEEEGFDPEETRWRRKAKGDGKISLEDKA